MSEVKKRSQAEKVGWALIVVNVTMLLFHMLWPGPWPWMWMKFVFMFGYVASPMLILIGIAVVVCARVIRSMNEPEARERQDLDSR